MNYMAAKWYKAVDMSELLSKIINKLNYDKSIDFLYGCNKSHKRLNRRIKL